MSGRHAPHWLSRNTVPLTMQRVIIALAPVTLCTLLWFGVGVISNLLLLVLFCAALEAAALTLRQRDVRAGLADCSAIVTALLLGLTLPPALPWWLLLVAAVFAIALAKHVYGGLGQNPFNPAMVGYLAVLIAFPDDVARWPQPAFAGMDQVDAVSAATPLDSIKMQLNQMRTMAEITAQPAFGLLAGRGWEWINLAALGGGLWLLRKQVISWHVPGSMLLTLAAAYFLLFAFTPATQPSPVIGLLSGGTMLAAFFIATDPVSGAASDTGKIIFGIGVALFCFGMRTWGAYPDGIAFAVLLMNTAVPLIDRWTAPRIYGHRERPR